MGSCTVASICGVDRYISCCTNVWILFIYFANVHKEEALGQVSRFLVSWHEYYTFPVHGWVQSYDGGGRALKGFISLQTPSAPFRPSSGHSSSSSCCSCCSSPSSVFSYPPSSFSDPPSFIPPQSSYFISSWPSHILLGLLWSHDHITGDYLMAWPAERRSGSSQGDEMNDQICIKAVDDVVYIFVK